MYFLIHLDYYIEYHDKAPVDRPNFTTSFRYQVNSYEHFWNIRFIKDKIERCSSWWIIIITIVNSKHWGLCRKAAKNMAICVCAALRYHAIYYRNILEWHCVLLTFAREYTDYWKVSNANVSNFIEFWIIPESNSRNEILEGLQVKRMKIQNKGNNFMNERVEIIAKFLNCRLTIATRMENKWVAEQI